MDGYFFGLWLHLIIFFIVLLLFIVIAIVTRKKFDRAQYIFALVLTGCVAVYFGMKSGQFLLDLPYVNNNEYFVYEGTMLGYAYRAEGNSPDDPITKYPILQYDENSPKEIFRIGSLRVGHRYILKYLPHTRLAEIIEEIPTDHGEMS